MWCELGIGTLTLMIIVMIVMKVIRCILLLLLLILMMVFAVCRDDDICDYGINDYYNCNTYFIDTGNNRKKDAGGIVVFKRVIQIFIALNVRMVSMMVLLTVME